MNIRTTNLTCLLSLLSATIASSAPIVTPYFNDFSTDPASAFTPSTNYNGAGMGSIGWDSETETYNSTLNDIGEYGQVNTNWATVSASNLDGANSNFFISSDFQVISSTDAGGSASVGLGVSNAVNFPIYSSASYYYGNFRVLDTLGSSQGQLNIYQSDGTTGTSIVTPLIFSGFTAGTTYTMSLAGTYSGSELTLTFTVTDGITSQTVAGTVTNTFSGLTNFGYQHVIANAVNDTVAFDNFSLSSVPEPSAFALLAAGSCVLSFGAARRRTFRRG
jgi:hypothetical protein